MSRQTTYACRLLCCAPPFALAFAFPNLSRALGFTGMVGILLPFVVTPVLHAASRRACHAKWGREYFDAVEADSDYHSAFWSSPRLVAAFGVGGAALLVGVGVLTAVPVEGR